jgi:sugar/nucleoside kinase (ribokinase family)
VVTSTEAVTASIGPSTVQVRVPASGPAVDTTGSGDAFAAGLVAALLPAPWPPPTPTLEAALADAARIATQVAHAPGAQGRVAAEARA